MTLDGPLKTDEAERVAAAGAQAGDATATQLPGTLVRPENAVEHPDIDKAWAEYEADVARARKVLLAALSKKMEAARKAGDLTGIDSVKVEVSALESQSLLPQSISTKGYEAAVKRAKTKLTEAYSAAIKECVRQSRIDDARSLKKEIAGWSLNMELLQNPGAEEPLEGGRIPGWTPVQAAWQVRTNDPEPNEGRAYFWPPAVPVAEIYQDVSLTPFSDLVRDGKLELVFRAAVRSFAQSRPDSSQIIVEFRDATNRNVLDSWDFGKTQSTAEWRLLSGGRAPNKEAAWVRVRLIGTRSGGTNNDGYFDSLSLKAVGKD